MPCEHVHLGHDEHGKPIVAIVCTRGRRGRKPCRVCKAREHERLCDYPLRGAKAGKTCSAPLCASCAVHMPPNRDYCPAHAKLVREHLALGSPPPLPCQDAGVPEVDDKVAQLAGVAKIRGELWGDRVREKASGPWPAWDDDRAARVRELARARVADLAVGDAELLERLARLCAEAAAAAYTNPRPRPGGTSFKVGR